MSGSIAISAQSVNSIGDGVGGLTATERVRYGSPLSSQLSYVRLSRDANYDTYTTVVLLGQTETFEGMPSTGALPDDYTSGEIHIEGDEFVYTQKDGTVARFEKVVLSLSGSPTRTGYLKSVTYPAGDTLDVDFVYGGNMQFQTSAGYALTGSISGSRWTPIAANLKNGSCSSGSCPGPSYVDQAALGRSLTTSISGSTMTVARPTGGAALTFTIDAESRVASVTNGVSTWTYSYVKTVDERDGSSNPIGGILTTTATDPLGHVRVVVTRWGKQHIISDTNGVGKTTSFQYSEDARLQGAGQLTQITWPEGNRTRLEYDEKYNVTAKWEDPKPGSGLASTKVEASYSYGVGSVCATSHVCDKPDWVRDARGDQTDYTYAAAHGGVVTVTRPAGPNGVRPQTRYTYGQFTARYYKGGVLTTGAPVWRVTRTSTCQTLASCADTADEVVTDYVYEDSSQPNNIRLLSTTTRAGNSSLSATTSYSYNDRGDVIAVDGPLPGAADTTWSYYDASRWKTGVIGPDPDGTGPRLYRASRTTYDADGKVTLSETGTATSQGTAGMSSFSPLQFQRSTYDAQARLAKVEEGQP